MVCQSLGCYGWIMMPFTAKCCLTVSWWYVIRKIRMCSELPVYFTVFDLGEISVDALNGHDSFLWASNAGPSRKKDTVWHSVYSWKLFGMIVLITINHWHTFWDLNSAIWIVYFVFWLEIMKNYCKRIIGWRKPWKTLNPQDDSSSLQTHTVQIGKRSGEILV